MPCRRLASKAQQKQRRLFRGWGERGGFFGAGESGERGIPLFAKKQNNIQKLENIRENTTLRNLESSTDSESSSTEPNTDSKIDAESREILKIEQRQNLSLKESTESKADLEF